MVHNPFNYHNSYSYHQTTLFTKKTEQNNLPVTFHYGLSFIQTMTSYKQIQGVGGNEEVFGSPSVRWLVITGFLNIDLAWDS